MKREKKGREVFNEEREKKVVMMLHIRQNNKMNPCVSSLTQNAALTCVWAKMV